MFSLVLSSCTLSVKGIIMLAGLGNELFPHVFPTRKMVRVKRWKMVFCCLPSLKLKARFLFFCYKDEFLIASSPRTLLKDWLMISPPSVTGATMPPLQK